MCSTPLPAGDNQTGGGRPLIREQSSFISPNPSLWCTSSLSKIFSAAWHWCPSVSTVQSLMHGDSCRVLITLEGFAIAMTSLEVAAGCSTSIRGP